MAGGGAQKAQARDEGHAVHSVLAEKSRNVLMGSAKRAVVGTQAEFDLKLGKELCAVDSEPVPALLTPVEPSTFVTSDGKSEFAASPTSSTSFTTAEVTEICSNDATPDLFVSAQYQIQRQNQRRSLQGGCGNYEFDFEDAAPVAGPRTKLGLTPATASFTAAAANYATKHRNLPGVPQLQLPTSPSPSIAFSSSLTSLSTQFLSSSYQDPPLSITTSNTALSTLYATSLSRSSSIASLTSASSSQAVPRPNSRRRNLVTIHSDKTFSIVPREAKASISYVRPNHPPVDLDSTKSSGRKSPPLSYVTTTVCSASSHERLSSDVFSGESHPSSPLTSSFNIHDRSSLSPFISSPGSSSAKPATSANPSFPAEPAIPASNDSDTAAFTQSSVWNYRLAGGLRKVPETPEPEHKVEGRFISSSSSSRYSELDAYNLPLQSEFPPCLTSKIAGLPATDSDTRDAGTHRHRKSSAESEQSARALSTGTGLSFTASIVSARTNYEVYAHSSSPAGAASSSAGLDSADSFYLLPSSSHSNNIEILGVSSPAASPLPTLQRSNDPNQTFASLASYPSIASFDTGVSESSAPNVVILGASSPPAPSRYLERSRSDEDASSILETDLPSSPPLPPRSANIATAETLTSNDSEPNYVLHGEPSFMSLPPQTSSSHASSLVTTSRQPRPAFSQESLVVRPLKTVRARRSDERLSYFKSHSRESLRHAASIKSLASNFGQEASSILLAGQAFLNMNTPPISVFTESNAALKAQRQLLALSTKPSLLPVQRKPLSLPAPMVQHDNYVVYDRTPNKNVRYSPSDVWDSPLSSQLTSSPHSPSLPQQPKQYKQATVQMVESYPHQWSSQLSTVMSETDNDSLYYSPHSRPASVALEAPGGNFLCDDGSVANGPSGYRSSTSRASSAHSRNTPSMSSSLGMQPDEPIVRYFYRDAVLVDRPMPVYFRTTFASPAASSNAAPTFLPVRTIRDHDEDGDGLADLEDVGYQASRSALSGFFSSNNGSARNLHSSGSMRSVASGTFPSWARVYYGSGEHRPLSAGPSVSDLGQSEDRMSVGSRPNSAIRRSPTGASMLDTVFNNRRRPKEVQAAVSHSFTNAAVLEAGEAGVVQDYRRHAPGLRKMTSSVWSPHLQIDRRATRFSAWEPPSVTWTTNANSTFDRRNLQVICFTLGFILPFVWMIAAFLPLAQKLHHTAENCAEGEFGVPAALKQRIAQSDEMRYQSTRWWRTLNRMMSVLGLFILGAVAALVVVGTRQGWGR
ncbi:hypothetical protein SEPCBS57363_003438 [Sporothrix epigloea]|uniref:Serine-rich protein n=1 Tax=Sporothrix epigloea TaxID=1892477 RepID=A0ABP0DLG8_9PEZI